jgi:hypothetical protein
MFCDFFCQFFGEPFRHSVFHLFASLISYQLQKGYTERQPEEKPDNSFSPLVAGML